MKFHDELNQKIFSGEELKPEVKDKLKEIADAFIDFLEVPADAIKDVVITGSSVSYNYTKFSDIDLHLKVDFDKIHEDCPIVQGYLWQSKAMFNKNHDISIYGIPVEVYAESIDEDTVHNGLYSLWQDKWIDFPQKIKPTDNDAAVEAKFNEFKEMADNINDSEEAEEIINKLYEMRKAGLEDAGEFSTENLAFKKVRDAGILDKLKAMKKARIDKQLSLESYNEEEKTFGDYFYSFNHAYTLDKWFLIHCFDGYKPKKYKSIEISHPESNNGIIIQNKGEKRTKDKGNFFYLLDLKGKAKSIDSSEITTTIYQEKVWIPDNITDEGIGGALKTFCKNWSNTNRYANDHTEYRIELFDLTLDKDCKESKAIEQFLKQFENLLQNIDDRVTWEKANSNTVDKNESIKKSENITAKINKLIDNVNKIILDTIKNKKEAKIYTLKQNKNKDGQTVLKLYRGDREFMTSKLVGDTLLGDDIIGHLNSIKSSKYESINEEVEETKNYKRTRLCSHKSCKKGSFRTKTVNKDGDKIVLCKDKETGKMKAQSKLEKKNESTNEEIKNNYKTSDFSELNKSDLHCHGISRFGSFKKYNIYGAFNFICYNLQDKNIKRTNLIDNESFEVWAYTDTSDWHETHIIVAPKQEVTIKEISETALKAREILDKKLLGKKNEDLNDTEKVKDIFRKYPNRTTGQAKEIAKELDTLATGTHIEYKLDNDWHECICMLVKTDVNKTFKDVKTNWSFYYSVDGEIVKRKECTAFDVANMIKADDTVEKLIVKTKEHDLKESYKEGIYKPSLILKAYSIEHAWYKEAGKGEDEKLPEIMLFIIEDGEIKGTKKVKREDVYTYKGAENEYYLRRVRDTEDIITDYNLEHVQHLVDDWNAGKRYLAMSKNEDIATLTDKIDAADSDLKDLIDKLQPKKVDEDIDTLCDKVDSATSELQSLIKSFSAERNDIVESLESVINEALGE